MLKPIMKAGAIALLVAATAALPAQVLGQTTNQAPVEKKAATEKKSRPIPFQGEIASVDKVAKTITVGKRTFQVTSTTKIAKADRTPALFEDAKTGEHVSGSYTKSDAGKLIARSVYLGSKPESEKAEKKQ